MAPTIDERSLRRAIADAPSSPRLLNVLGAACGGRGDSAAAAAWFRRLLTTDAKSTDGVVNVGFACLQDRRWAEALSWIRRSIALLPDHTLAHYNRGVAALRLGLAAEAAVSSARARAIDPTHLDAPYNEALAHLTLGNWRKGFALYECRWNAPSFPIRWRPAPGRRWDGARAPGKTLLLMAEQGSGDTIQFIRYAALAAPLVGRVVVAAPPFLLRLLSRARGVSQAIDARGAPEGIDLHLPLLSLPHVFGTEPDSVPAEIPYFDITSDRIAEGLRSLLPSDRPRVGLCWRGNPAFANDANRSPGLSAMKAALTVPGVSFVNLVKERMPAETTGLDLIEPMDQVEDFLDTAMLVASLDLVVTCDTAVAHLAGALGRQTWILLPAAGDWRWLTQGTRTPWYPTATLFRQSTPGRWDDVGEHVGRALASWLIERTRS